MTALIVFAAIVLSVSSLVINFVDEETISVNNVAMFRKGAADIRAMKRAQTERIVIVGDLICYCFGYAEADIHHDFMQNGKSTIMEKIQMEKKFGNCQCAAKNPKGK